MNFEEIKTGFVEYLKSKTKEDTKAYEKLEEGNVSLFSHFREFKQYLKAENIADSSIFAKDLNDVMKMKFEDGKLIEDDSAKEKSDKTDEKNSKTTLNDEDKELITGMINDMLQDEDVMTSLDVNSSGDLDEDEVNKFLEFATNEKTGKMSLNSLSKSANSIYETSALLDDIYSDSYYGKFLDEDKDGKIGDEEKDKFEKYLKGDKDILELEDVERAKDLMDKDVFSYDIPNDSVADEDYEESIANNTATKSSPASSSAYGGYTTGNPGSASSN